MAYVKDRWYNKDGSPTDRCDTGMRWQVKYRKDGREKDGGSFTKKGDAEKRRIEIESSMLRGRWVDHADKTTVIEWMRHWSSMQTHGKRTADRFERDIRNHVEGTPFGNCQLNRLRVSDAKMWLKSRRERLAPSTIRIIAGMVRSAIRAAIADHLLEDDPFASIDLPEIEDERVVPLEDDQVESLIDFVQPRHRGILVVQAGLGLRVGEALGLCLDNVDFLRREVRIRRQADPDTGELVGLKTKSSRRTIPLPERVAEELSVHIASFPVGKRPGHEGLLFHNSAGRPHWREHYHPRVFHPAVLALHKRDSAFPVDATPHDLRHYYATTLLDAGIDMVTVAEYLGHKDATLVAKTYGHRRPGQEYRIRDAIDAAFARAGASQTRPERSSR
jgi:integrase